MLSWFTEKGVKQGIFWAIMICLSSSLNDVLMRFLGGRLHVVEIVFFRFLFSAVIVLIPILKSKNNLFKSSMHGMHIIRGILGAVALALCCYSVNVMPMVENTTIMFSISLFMLPLAVFFLKEKISAKTLTATIIGLTGLIIMFRPSASNFNLLAIIPTSAALLFAISNIVIKKMIDKRENNLTMLFYFGLYTTILSGVFVPFYWVTPNSHELLLILLLGVGANLIQLFLFLAYRATTASTISPVQYTELPFAIIFGFAFFGQIPDIIACIGAALIIVGTYISSRATK